LKRGRKCCTVETVTGVVNARRKMTGSADRWVPLSAREREKGEYRFGFAFWAAGYFSDLGRGVPRGPFLFLFCFLSFLFLFSISFIAFAYCIQIKSNQFQIFYKIQNNIPEQ
jgi:hypothetical protein